MVDRPVRTAIVGLAAAFASLASAGGAVAASPELAVQQELTRSAERCEGLEVAIRDEDSGRLTGLGPAAELDGAVVRVPEMGSQQVECMDGYLLVLAERPAASVAAPDASAQRVAVKAEQDLTLAAIRPVVPTVEVAGRYALAVNALHLRMRPSEAATLEAAGFELWENGEVRADLAQSVPMIRADQVRAQQGVSGAGATIAIVDTGIDYTHPDLGGCLGTTRGLLTKVLPCKVEGGYDVFNGDADPADDHGHGTHVAAIAAGAGEQPGVAPGASLLAYKVLGAGGWGTMAQVIEGIERSVDPDGDGSPADRADVINLSLGAGGGSPADPLALAVEGAVASGAVVVVAAGNATWRDIDESNVLTPGVSPAAITVGASSKADQIAYFSSRGPVRWAGRAIVKPDLVAPGEEICAARGAGAWETRVCDGAGTRVSLSGTSMAAPHVAGVAALIEEANPSLDPAAVKATIKGTAQPLQVAQSVVTQGTGRVDAFAAVEGAEAPVIAALDPIRTSGETRTITGRVEASAIRGWTLSYTRYRAAYIPESGWTELVSSDEAPADDALFDLDTRTVPDGRHIVRLEVVDADGERAVDYGYTEIDKIRFAHPLDLDVARGGDPIEVDLDVEPSLPGATFVLEAAPETSGAWTEIARGGSPDATWRTEGLPADTYRLRLTATHDGIVESETVRVTLDPRLAPGWPVRVPTTRGCEGFSAPCPLFTGWIDPVVADMDADGEREILFARYAPVPEIWAYGPDGARRWTAKVGATPANPSYYAFDVLHAPVLGDIEGDGKHEAFFFNAAEQRLYAVNASGIPAGAWDVPFGPVRVSLPRLVLADVNADGFDELVLSVHVNGRQKLTVLTQQGVRLAEWYVAPKTSAPYLLYSASYASAPAVGNLDADPALEIVMVDDRSTTIHAFDWTGTELPGWPVQGTWGARGNFPPVIGDLDGDGAAEVVAGVVFGAEWRVELHALRADGSAMAGWPIRMNDRYLHGGVSLADLDGAPGLEVLVPFEGRTTAYRHDGSTAPGWPAGNDARGDYQALVADLDGDGREDVLQHESNGGRGRLLAWSADGAPIAGFGNRIERSLRAPLAVSAASGAGPGMIVGASDSDIRWGLEPRWHSKERASLYVWDAGIAPGPASWPAYQRDPGRTGSL